MRLLASLLVLALLAASGCLGPAPPASPAPAVLCPSPCEVPVDVGPDRAFEPVIAVDPRDAARAVVVSTVFPPDGDSGMPDRFKVHATTDRGASFVTAYFDDLLPPTDPVRAYTQWADPRLVWLPRGDVLLFGMAARGGTTMTPPVAFTSYDLFVARSADGGRSWAEGRVLAEGRGAMTPVAQTLYHDQPHVALGPDGALLLAWIRAFAHPDGSAAQDVLASRSEDGGRSWSDPVVVDEGLFHNARPAFGPGGVAFVAYRDYADEPPERAVLLSRSDDGGKTWERVDLGGVTSVSRPSLVADEAGAHLLVVEPVAGAHPEVRLATWRDGHVSRSTLARMLGEGEPLVTLASDGAGGLWATWHVVQPDGSNAYHAWHRSRGGATREARIDATPIGPNDPQGLIGWPSLGDYHGLDATPAGAVATWVSGEREGQDVRAAWLR